MRKIITFICFLAMIFSAQTGFSQNPPVKLGLQVSPNIGWMSPKSKDYNSNGANMGVTIGLISDFYFTDRYAFSTGVNFSFLNGKLNYPDAQDSMTGQRTRKYSFIYLEIPTQIKMQTKNFGKYSLYGQIGFSTGFRLTSSVKDEFTDEKTSAVSNSKNDAVGITSLIRESVVIGFGTEYHLDESSRIIAGLAYSNALNNILSGSNNKTGLNEKSLLNLVELKIGFIF